MSKTERIQQAKQNAEANIELMATWPHKKLAERLELVNIQSEIAEQKRDTEALDLLEVWRAQLIEARIHKYENNIPDEVNEIQEAIADIEMVTAKLEERQEILSEEEPVTSKNKTRPNLSSERVSQDSQLPLF